MPHERMMRITRRKAHIQQPSIRRLDDLVRVKAGEPRQRDIRHVEPSAHRPVLRMQCQPAVDVGVAPSRLGLPAGHPITHRCRVFAGK